jgi:hypothetical protein
MNRLLDILLAPFRAWPAEVALVAFGAATGLLVMVIFKLTSRPERVARARDRALSRVIELWLYRHDPLLGFGSIGRMLADNGRYLATLAVPMVCSLLPMLLLLAQGHDWFASRALAPGETMLVVARLRPGVPAGLLDETELALERVPLRLAAPPVRTPAWREIAWSVTAEGSVDLFPAQTNQEIRKAGRGAKVSDNSGFPAFQIQEEQGGANKATGPEAVTPTTPTATPPLSPRGGELVIRAGGAEIRKTVAVDSGLARRTVRRTAGRADHLLHLGEPRLSAASPFARIETRWPAAEYNLLGWRTDWFRGLLAVSLIAGLLLKKPLRVEF